MMTRTLFSHCATVAIAASVALPAMPALAQDAAVADPVIVLPAEAAPATAPAPQITLPEPVAAPTLAPVQAEVLERVTTATPATTSQRAAATTPTSTRASAVNTARVTPTETATASQTTAEPLASTIATVPEQPVTSPDVSDPAPAPLAVNGTVDSNTDELALAGILGALGLVAVGGIAFAASRRRRSNIEPSEVYEPVAYQQIDEPIVEAPVAVEAQPIMTQRGYAAPAVTIPAMTRSTGNGDPVALPAEMPETFEERDALLHELVAAKPDKANPFTSPRARARRAKLIMQSLGQSFKDRKPRINLSEYTNRWPSLRGWQPATA